MNLDIEKMLKENKTLDDILNKVFEEFDRVQKEIEYKKKLAEQKKRAEIAKNNLVNAYIEYLDATVSSLTEKERELLKIKLFYQM